LHLSSIPTKQQTIKREGRKNTKIAHPSLVAIRLHHHHHCTHQEEKDQPVSLVPPFS